MAPVKRKRFKRRANPILGKPANFVRRNTKMKLGDHLVQCDVTGQVCFKSEARLTWRGLLVSNQNWDRKHPQLTIEIDGSEDVAVMSARPFKASFQSDLPSVQLTDQIIEGV